MSRGGRAPARAEGALVAVRKHGETPQVKAR